MPSRSTNALGRRARPSSRSTKPRFARSRAAIKAGGKVNAIAVVLLHSYLTPNHEQRIKAIFAEEIPDIPVSISYEVLPKWKEHFRSSTTICDAFIKPVVDKTAWRHAS